MISVICIKKSFKVCKQRAVESGTRVRQRRHTARYQLRLTANKHVNNKAGLMLTCRSMKKRHPTEMCKLRRKQTYHDISAVEHPKGGPPGGAAGQPGVQPWTQTHAAAVSLLRALRQAAVVTSPPPGRRFSMLPVFGITPFPHVRCNGQYEQEGEKPHPDTTG